MVMVYMSDDGASGHDALPGLLRSAGLRACTFSSADALLQAGGPAEKGSVVADVRKHGKSGQELQRELCNGRSSFRAVFITPRDLEEAFLVQPLDDHALLDAIQWALS
ncbi:MAG: response regulator transcription factor [Pirellulaceae bacterium]